MDATRARGARHALSDERQGGRERGRDPAHWREEVEQDLQPARNRQEGSTPEPNKVGRPGGRQGHETAETQTGTSRGRRSRARLESNRRAEHERMVHITPVERRHRCLHRTNATKGRRRGTSTFHLVTQRASRFADDDAGEASKVRSLLYRRRVQGSNQSATTRKQGRRCTRTRGRRTRAARCH